MFLFDFIIAAVIVGGAAAIFYFMFSNAEPKTKAVEAKKTVAPTPAKGAAVVSGTSAPKPSAAAAAAPTKAAAAPAKAAAAAEVVATEVKKPSKKDKKKAAAERAAQRAAEEAEMDALVAADLKFAAQGIRNDSRRGVAVSLEEANRKREQVAAKKAEAKAALNPVVHQEVVLEEGFVAVKSDNKKPINKKPSEKAVVERETLTAAEEMDRRLRQFFRNNNNNSSNGKKFSPYGQDDRKTDAPIRIKATGANKGWGGEDN